MFHCIKIDVHPYTAHVLLLILHPALKKLVEDVEAMVISTRSGKRSLLMMVATHALVLLQARLLALRKLAVS